LSLARPAIRVVSDFSFCGPRLNQRIKSHEYRHH
jgi:hypothetical protein